MTSGPFPGEPFADLGVISCGVIETAAVVEDCVELFVVLLLFAELQPASNNSTVKITIPGADF
jgi:hypothetical protein